MKATFPLMGDTFIGFGKALQGFGHDVVLPKALSKKTIRIGVKHSPEYACWPFKVSLGSIIEGLDLGAEMVATLGGRGPCRAGWYGELQKKILVEELGYDIKHFYPAYHYKDMYRMSALGGKSKAATWKAMVRAYDFQHTIEDFEAKALKNRAREENLGENTKIYDEIRDEIWEAHTFKELRTVRRRGHKTMDDIPVRTDFEPLKIGITGEIYVVLDPFANLEIEKKLGNMGVQVHRSIWLSHWVKRELVLNKLPLTKIYARREIAENAKPYLNEFVGGDGIESIANMRVYKKMNYDGVIEIGPFTCIPEIVAKSILPAMSRDLDLPVLTFNVDEHTGEAGVATRLEAFSDLLSQRRDGIPLPSRRISALVEDEEAPANV